MPHVVLLVGLVWVLLSLVAYFFLLPLLRAGGRADEAAGREGPGSTVGSLPSAPIEAAYAGLVLQRLTVHTTTVLGATEVCLMAMDDRPAHRLLTVAEQGIGAEAILEAPPPAHLIAWRAIADGGSIAEPTRTGPAAITATPIFWEGHVRGALSVAIPVAAGGSVEARQIGLLENLGSVVGRALEHQRRRELISAYIGAEVVALLEALIRTDPSTHRYGPDVVWLARRVGEVLGMDAISLYELKLVALLRDIGRLRLPAGPAGRDVWAMHPVWGSEMVAGIPGLEPLAPLVRAHHERWDGRGYPDGLTETRIPLASRIVAACEVAARSPNELEQGSGMLFDPGVVNILEDGLRGGFPSLR
jgi:HD domain-containing protein